MGDVITPTEPAASSAEPDSGSLDALLAEVARPPSLSTQFVADVKARAGLTTLELLDGSHLPLLESGTIIDGRYRLQHVLGHGGMGVVYAAESIQTGRKVAVKCIVLRSAAARGEHPALARFRREARAVARIRHPNVVDVYDAGGHGALPYLVMELLEGESLRARLQRSRCGWDEARSLLLPLLAGLSAAHRAGVVHRDLKPDNIFLARGSGERMVPKLLDFGIATVHETASEGAPPLTRTGTVLGTPNYMAPEQLTGGTVDARTDVYGLGVTLYEMLSGQLPFSARSAPELAVLQATGAAVPLSAHCPELSGQVENTVMRALAHDPAERYPHGDAFAAAIADTRVGPAVFSFKKWHGVALASLLGLITQLGARELSPTVPHRPVVRQRTASPSVRSSATPRPAPYVPIPQLAAPTTASQTVPPMVPTRASPSTSSPRRSRGSRGPALEPAPPTRAPADLSIDEF